jgi:hypothetical protein
LLAISRCFSGDIDAKPRRSFRIASTAILLAGFVDATPTGGRGADRRCAREPYKADATPAEKLG